MSEPKPFASLSSGLLARKGAARPAMRPQGFGQGGAALEDLGWDDMGFEAPKPAEPPRDGEHDAFGEEIVEHPRSLHPSGLTPVDSPVHGQQAEIADRFAETPEPVSEETAEAVEVEAEAEVAEDEDFDETAELYEPPFEALEPEAAEHAQSMPAKKMAIVFADAPAEPALEAPAAEPAVEPLPAAPHAAPVVLRRTTRQRSAPGAKDKAAFTLRLDQSRHLKLRLACAVHGRSAQMIVTEALDQMLAAMPELDAMAEKAKSKGT